MVDDGRSPGSLGFHRIDRDNRSTSIGYWLARSARGPRPDDRGRRGACRPRVRRAAACTGSSSGSRPTTSAAARSRSGSGSPRRAAARRRALRRRVPRPDHLLAAGAGVARSRRRGLAENLAEGVEEAPVLLRRPVADPDVAGPAQRRPRRAPGSRARRAPRRPRPRRASPSSTQEKFACESGVSSPSSRTPSSTVTRSTRLRSTRSATSSPWRIASAAAAWASALTLNGWRTASTAERNFGEQIA